ncbi:MAG: hypothetical protein M1831_004125 [Alyxoria varia]|nr:MAG: hypothetical protein M1831_004125 [Alyxoria varia]
MATTQAPIVRRRRSFPPTSPPLADLPELPQRHPLHRVSQGTSWGGGERASWSGGMESPPSQSQIKTAEYSPSRYSVAGSRSSSSSSSHYSSHRSSSSTKVESPQALERCANLKNRPPTPMEPAVWGLQRKNEQKNKPTGKVGNDKASVGKVDDLSGKVREVGVIDGNSGKSKSCKQPGGNRLRRKRLYKDRVASAPAPASTPASTPAQTPASSSMNSVTFIGEHNLHKPKQGVRRKASGVVLGVFRKPSEVRTLKALFCVVV